jgi:hypothetical protein
MPSAITLEGLWILSKMKLLGIFKNSALTCLCRARHNDESRLYLEIGYAGAAGAPALGIGEASFNGSYHFRYRSEFMRKMFFFVLAATALLLTVPAQNAQVQSETPKNVHLVSRL